MSEVLVPEITAIPHVVPMASLKEDALQLDQAAWESLRGLIRSEIQSHSSFWSESLEKSRAQLESRLAEFQGILNSVDKEHGKVLQSLDDRQGHAEGKLTSLGMDLHKSGAAARGELRRACIEIETKITTLESRDDSEKQKMVNKMDRECQAIREQQQASSNELLAKIQDLQQQFIHDRAERQATESRCMQYTDRQVAATMASKQLEERFQVVKDSVTTLSQTLQRVETSVRADLKQYSNELCGAVSLRMDEMSELANRRHAEMEVNIDECNTMATEAAASADKAVKMVDSSLHEKVNKASRALMDQIEAAAIRAQKVATGDEQTNEQATKAAAQHKVRLSGELQSGFYGLIAREALGTELRVLVDRATQRMQFVSDDLAKRSAAIQEHVVAAEERLNVTIESAMKHIDRAKSMALSN